MNTFLQKHPRIIAKGKEYVTASPNGFLAEVMEHFYLGKYEAQTMFHWLGPMQMHVLLCGAVLLSPRNHN